MENAAPQLHKQAEARAPCATDYDDDVVDAFDAREVFDLIRDINDPEHPHTLEELNVVQMNQIDVDDTGNAVRVQFTPTIPHCSMATLIGLCIRVRLLRSLPRRFKVDVEIFPGSHVSRDQVNKQLSDKERVAAALENPNLLQVVNQCLSH
ncbi:hypothetical protein PTSG_06588 [Salpingoeca rosetta]|uniref:MIP18 family-like domain-containing protein n=1 Tax=Salpingoeca rosetta (strain ATCC 50818 / BSB-021) TaxID=946362 RepID=F2UFE9_SALR5|nr:uncharacterized protein PTSG_06588 [Salpingoeca rosetta]EGD75517.1 hypothetical protein PTSG_06588 [Salpingoeca rosetta]|eukprot:XP_004991974.1 hypothetical protein PTSG_06588 [Salpingoeca rosetta]